ncbi:Cationic peroxidase 1 [Cinnamomum micranthum f. kanehirae]|uniref:Cationic peroxidase 1 n=1 Tax=Cinnamomum micranthum f. kanehirae TaxID=337451 RepID=A0A443NRV8_9MAGN|nr:Cationic peroxidase 1 [Cinnamomum micranthum f. kanehirae]
MVGMKMASFTISEDSAPNTQMLTLEWQPQCLSMVINTDNTAAMVQSYWMADNFRGEKTAAPNADSLTGFDLGGLGWMVELGRRHSLTASLTEANTDLPASKANISSLINFFSKKGLTAAEMVALSGAHTIGMAKCPPKPLCNLDSSTPDVFDNGYYKNPIKHNGLLISEQELFNGGPTDAPVQNNTQPWKDETQRTRSIGVLQSGISTL